MNRIYTEDVVQFMQNEKEHAAFKEKLEGEIVTLYLKGNISGEVNNAIFDEMTALIVAGKWLILDLEKTTYLSASFMEILLKIERKMEEQSKYLRIVQMPQSIYDEFKARGMHELLEIEVVKS